MRLGRSPLRAASDPGGDSNWPCEVERSPRDGRRPWPQGVTLPGGCRDGWRSRGRRWMPQVARVEGSERPLGMCSRVKERCDESCLRRLSGPQGLTGSPPPGRCEGPVSRTRTQISRAKRGRLRVSGAPWATPSMRVWGPEWRVSGTREVAVGPREGLVQGGVDGLKASGWDDRGAVEAGSGRETGPRTWPVRRSGRPVTGPPETQAEGSARLRRTVGQVVSRSRLGTWRVFECRAEGSKWGDRKRRGMRCQEFTGALYVCVFHVKHCDLSGCRRPTCSECGPVIGARGGADWAGTRGALGWLPGPCFT